MVVSKPPAYFSESRGYYASINTALIFLIKRFIGPEWSTLLVDSFSDL